MFSLIISITVSVSSIPPSNTIPENKDNHIPEKNIKTNKQQLKTAAGDKKQLGKKNKEDLLANQERTPKKPNMAKIIAQNKPV